MPLPLLPFALKGLFVLGKVIIAKGGAAKAGIVLAKSVATAGVASTAGTVLTVGIVVGGVCWIQERVDNLERALEAIREKDHRTAVFELARLAISIGGPVNALPHAVRDYLETIHVAEAKVEHIEAVIGRLGNRIAAEVKELR